jgi:aryl-alcohol dehydrogenase-like predicted oxidoreductase
MWVQNPTSPNAAYRHVCEARPLGRTIATATGQKNMVRFLARSTSRRALIKGTVGLGVLAAQSAGTSSRPKAAPAQQAGPAAPAADIITRAIPRTNEKLPVIGRGTFLTFDTIPGQPRENLREVIRHYWDAGCRLIDTSSLYGTAEITVGDFCITLGINERMFVADKIWATGEFLTDESHALRSLDLSLGRLWRERIDLMQCHSLVNFDVIVPYLKAWKKEGRIRYVGVTHYENAYHEPLADWVERGDVDFVQVNYSIFNRAAERHGRRPWGRSHDQHALRKGAAVPRCRGEASSGLRPPDRYRDLVPILSQVGYRKSSGHVRVTVDLESRTRPRKCCIAAGYAS